MVNSNIIQIIDANFGYTKHDKVIIKNCNLSIPTNNLIGLIGINGSGKSTFLKTLSGFLPLISGDILFKNKSIYNYSIQDLSNLISITLTEKISGFNLTCYDAIASGLLKESNLFGNLNEEQKEKINSIIKNLNLVEVKDLLLNELSDGMYQKTMIAKSVVQNTPIMLLDEPTAFLDFSSKHELFKNLSKIATESNKCIIVSTHELDFVLKYCSLVIILANNTLNSVPANQVLNHKDFIQLTGGFL
ncbi:MAG: ABC transporter ATP-binding protein [Bacteroidetes bacterium]|nr:ABC transporter ATP-binding protein [Bacteroidota bacterium]